METDEKAPRNNRRILSVPTLIASLVCAQIAVLFCEPYICEPFQLGAYAGIVAYVSGLLIPVIVRIIFLALRTDDRQSLTAHDV